MSRCWVLGPDGSWLPLGAPDCSWLPLVAPPGCSRLLLAPPGCCWLLLAAPGCSWLLLAAPGCSWLLLVAPGGSWLLLAGLSWFLPLHSIEARKCAANEMHYHAMIKVEFRVANPKKKSIGRILAWRPVGGKIKMNARANCMSTNTFT